MGSSFRTVVKRLAPPVLLDLARGRLATRHPYTWEGVYRHLRDVPVENAGYGDADHMQDVATQSKALLGELNAGRRPRLWHELLAVVAATASAHSQELTVVDFGGGLGTGYIHLHSVLQQATTIDYHVIDLPEMCEKGREVFAGTMGISFHSVLADVRARPDIVYANSVLQYIEDYAGQIRALAALRAPLLLLARTAAGDVPTFASRQLTLVKKVMPYWFLNRDELVDILSVAGYRLAYESVTDREYDQSNFPPTHRIGRMRDLLFALA
ncbi:MAG: methyltransferase, TIGR04325 family [Methylocystis sp.]|nr:methyltransferase, TIGR04325 family [Methylocystis sp.]